jgi:hypothetical protein
MNRLLVLPLLLLLSTPASACDGGPLFEMMAAPLPKQADKSFDVGEVLSAEGGSWDVYLEPDGKSVANLVRTDYGETRRLETRLIVSSPAAYAVTSTTYHYSVPIFASGLIAIREEKDIFVYCSGKLYLPEEDLLGLAPDYPNKAAEAMKTFDAAEVAQYVSGLRR